MCQGVARFCVIFFPQLFPHARKASYMPTPKLCFQEPKSLKSRTWHNFQRHISKMSVHLWAATRFYGKITGQSYFVHLPYQLCAAWGCCLPITLDCLLVLSFHDRLTVLQTFRLHTSVTCLIYSDWKAASYGIISWTSEKDFITGDGLAGVQSVGLDSAMFSLSHKTFLQMASWFWSSTQLAASWMQCSFQETSAELLWCLVFCTCAEHLWEQISLFLSFVLMQHINKRLR